MNTADPLVSSDPQGPTDASVAFIPPEERVPLVTKVLWGTGGLADNFMMNTLITLGMLIYVDFFRLSPALAGIALFIPRFVDAVSDPYIGNWTDNAKTRWGRRRPFMFWGTILSAILLPLLWTPPFKETVGNAWYANVPFIYLCLAGTGLAITGSLFVIPYTALGWELTPNYDERTKTVAWRMYIGLAGSFSMGWLYRLSQLEYFKGNMATGAFWVCVGAGLIVLVFGLIPTFACRENLEVEKQPKIDTMNAMRYTLTNRPFAILFVAYIIIIIALFTTSGITPFLLIYYVFKGNKADFGSFQGVLTSLSVGCSYLSMWLISYIALRHSKGAGMLSGLGLALLGTAISWFTIDPRWPWAMYLSCFVCYLGLQGCWLMVDSMVADICDADELKTGIRREGMFSAVKAFALKLAQAITAALGGYMLVLAGFDPNAANSSGVSLDIAFRMKLMIVGGTCGGLMIAIAIMWLYPISRENAAATRAALEKRRAGA